MAEFPAPAGNIRVQLESSRLPLVTYRPIRILSNILELRYMHNGTFETMSGIVPRFLSQGTISERTPFIQVSHSEDRGRARSAVGYGESIIDWDGQINDGEPRKWLNNNFWL